MAMVLDISHIGYRLGKLSLMWSKIIEERLGLQGPQIRLLGLLFYSDGPVRQNGIEKVFSVSRATISVSLERLENQGLIKRKESAGDRRQKDVYLTEKGWAKAEELPAAFRRLHQICSIGLSEDEVKLFMELCKRVGESLQEQRETDLELLCMA